jgi:hypothetical protein
LEKSVLYQPQGTLALWPHISRTQAGDLLLVFTGNKNAVDDPLGRVYWMKSGDEGRTWSEPLEIQRSPLDTRYPALTQLSSGQFLLSYHPTSQYMDAIIPADLDEKAKETWEAYKSVTRPSRIETWQAPFVRLFDENLNAIGSGIRTAGFSRHGPLMKEDGNLLLVGEGRVENTTPALLIEEATPPEVSEWTGLTTMPAPPMDNPAFYRSPSVMRLRNGSLLALFGYQHLYQSGMNFLRRSFSEDGGKSWSIPRATKMWGTEPHAIEPESGKVVALYAFPAPRFSLRGVLSVDGGKSWDVETEAIISEAPTSEIHGGSSIQLEDGTVLTVFHQAPSEAQGPCLHAIRWKLAEGRTEPAEDSSGN